MSDPHSGDLPAIDMGAVTVRPARKPYATPRVICPSKSLGSASVNKTSFYPSDFYAAHSTLHGPTLGS
jgi:hypothetical protein